MIRSLINSAKGWLASRATKGGLRDEPEDLPTPRTQAYAELRAAEARGDCRGIGLARMRLAAATHDQLSAEVWGQ